jgi:hypothetical protein
MHPENEETVSFSGFYVSNDLLIGMAPEKLKAWPQDF